MLGLNRGHVPYDDGQPYYRKGLPPAPGLEPFATAVSKMTVTNARKLVAEMGKNDFQKRPYKSVRSFLQDVAAIAKLHPDAMMKRGAKGVAVRDSLAHFLAPSRIGYLLNPSRFASRHPAARMLKGTTGNEALHMQTKYMFRNVFSQSKRNALVVSETFTLAKLLSGAMKKGAHTIIHREGDLLRYLRRDPVAFTPSLNSRTVPGPVVHVESLPPNARRQKTKRLC